MTTHRAFTLIELVVACAIVATLAAVLLPSVIQATERARGATCLSNVRQLAAALLEYADTNDGCLPPPQRLEVRGRARRWVPWTETLGMQGLRCPARTDGRPSYGYNYGYLYLDNPRAALTRVRAESGSPAETVLLADGDTGLFAPSTGLWSAGWFVHSGGRLNVGWLDGHARSRGRDLMASDDLWDRR
jgi:prepilin-type N-terminal cleavage/methylation domain-containing protein/prepilin-type processing-associated H-X9-DG protein